MNPTAPIYSDFTSLAELRAQAGRHSPEATREAARQFEALFVQMMLKSMREAGAVFGQSTDRTYQEMFDQQIALDLTRRQSLGIAEMLMRQFAANAAAPGPSPEGPAAALSTDGARPSGSGAASPAAKDWRPASPEQFLADIWPLAERAGRRLGVDAKAIAAQAALETGWGRKMVRDAHGTSGNNLFNIKADARWSGPRVTVNTLEFADGLPELRQAQFRVYPSLADSFEDYVRFLSENPRYAQALRRGPSAEGFAQSLQEAGYATDPRYAEKLRSIMESPRFNATVARLKNATELPISS